MAQHTQKAPIMRRTRRILPLAAAALALTGCAVGQTEPTPTVTETVAAPTAIDRPDPLDSCTVDVRTTPEVEHPNEAVVTCGNDPITLSGDFRDQTMNEYDPAASRGVHRVMIVGREARVWTGECLLTHNLDADDTSACEPSGANAPATPVDPDHIGPTPKAERLNDA